MNSKLLLCLALVLSGGSILSHAHETEAPKSSRLTRQILACLLGIFCFWTAVCHADDRLWMNAKINGKPVRLIFDSGAQYNMLFTSAAHRLGITFTNPPNNYVAPAGEVGAGSTAECALTIGQFTFKTQMRTLHIPGYLHSKIDGMVGWEFARTNIILIDANHGVVKLLGSVPKGVAASWRKFRIQENARILKLEIPDGGGSKLIVVDTGFKEGVAISPAGWQQWRTIHAKQSVTLGAGYMPGAGIVIREIALAHHIALGPLCLTNVPIMEAYPPQVALNSPGFEAALGFAALERVEVLVDGKHGIAYIKFNKPTPLHYDYNRLGAVFVPANPTSNDLIARVAKGTPAWNSGIRNGDRLLKVNGLDATQWRTNPSVLPLLRQFFDKKPAGTILHLTLRKGKKTFESTVTLRDILTDQKP